MSVFRFAPTPNGFLHLGHAYSALLNAAMARALGGRFLLRLEDIDIARCRPEYEAAIYADLAWLGLAWEEPVRRQSQHLGDYGAALARLNGLLFPCFCSRGDIAAAVAGKEALAKLPWARDPDGAPLYPGTCRDLPRPASQRRIAAGEPHALRLHMARALESQPGPLTWRWLADDRGDASIEEVAAAPARWGDVVLARKEVRTSYHLAVVLDDALQGVTHVVRGRDLEASTDVHRLLQALLGLPTPLYRHHQLITDDAGLKLAKSLEAPSLRDLKRAGATAPDVRRSLGFRGRW